jgi:hypothetical protein
LQWQFREGMQGALGGIVGDRLQAIGHEIHAVLITTKRTDWDRVFQEFSEKRGFRLRSSRCRFGMLRERNWRCQNPCKG